MLSLGFRRCRIRTELSSLSRKRALADWKGLQDYLHSHDYSRLVVIDDDPTGCQTMHDVDVLLEHSVATLQTQLKQDEKPFFILTNSRSLTEPQASSVTKTVMGNLLMASKQAKYSKQLRIVSRSDSTLRGHYAAEVNTILQSKLGSEYTGVIFCPAFFEGNRYTLSNTHYLLDRHELVPVSETPFAKDPHFGFNTSHLPTYLQQKDSLISPDRVVCVSLEDLRGKDDAVQKVSDILLAAPKNAVVVVNATKYSDLATFTMGLVAAEKTGNRRFLIRSAASILPPLSGSSPRLPLTKEQLEPLVSRRSSGIGGLIVVGSYVPKTTAQVQHFLEHYDLHTHALNLTPLTDILTKQSSSMLENEQEGQIAEVKAWVTSVVQDVSANLQRGRDVVVYTPRTPLQLPITIQSAVSRAIAQVVRSLPSPPAFLIAKGGVTSHDLAQRGVGVARGKVAGQVIAGVPLWLLPWTSQTGQNMGDIAYVVFPGNVGGVDGLGEVAEKLGVRRKPVALPATKPLFTRSTSAGGGGRRHGDVLSVLREAESRGEAIAAFNIYNMEGVKAAIGAAEKKKAPIILQAHPSVLEFGGVLLGMLQGAWFYADTPVFLNLDHAVDRSAMERAVRAGFDMIMCDGSHLPYQDNLAWTTQMCEWLHKEGIVVEAELGKLSGEEDGLSIPLKEAKMTCPDQAAEFFQQTRCDLMAATIGNVHGKYKYPPNLDFARLQRIRTNLKATANQLSIAPPLLVLHGASGLPLRDLQKARQHGVVKFNVNTDLRHASMQFYRDVWSSEGRAVAKSIELLDVMIGVTKAMQVVAEDKIESFRA